MIITLYAIDCYPVLSKKDFDFYLKNKNEIGFDFKVNLKEGYLYAELYDINNRYVRTYIFSPKKQLFEKMLKRLKEINYNEIN